MVISIRWLQLRSIRQLLLWVIWFEKKGRDVSGLQTQLSNMNIKSASKNNLFVSQLFVMEWHSLVCKYVNYIIIPFIKRA